MDCAGQRERGAWGSGGGLLGVGGWWWRGIFVLLLGAGLGGGAVFGEAGGQGGGPWLELPTENRALFQGRPRDFYMHVERDFEGVKSRPWEGGMYGFTRGPRRMGGKVVMTRFHEGIDIAPVRRDARGEPLDEVRAAADGEVVHVSADARASNYGRYVVMRHLLEGAPYFTVYAHLGRVDAVPGQKLRRGEALGTVGWTGAGITRERAHLHFEFCLMWSLNFEGWFAHYLPSEINRHGLYNGMNLAGLDAAALLTAARGKPGLTVPQFVAERGRALLKIEVADSEHFWLRRLYPWLLGPEGGGGAPAWAVTFSRELIPLRIEPRASAQWPPRVEWMGGGEVPLEVASRGWVTGTPRAPRLTEAGMRFAHLLTFPDRAGE